LPPNWATTLADLSRNAAIANPTHVSDLPASWGTLYELSRIEPPRAVVGGQLRRRTIARQ
jgi:hypothetical protein